MEFHETGMGKNFYERTMPRIQEDLEREAKATEEQNRLLKEQNRNMERLCEEFQHINETLKYLRFR